MRVLIALGIAQILRILSFLGTALPGAATQCRLNFDQECLDTLAANASVSVCAVPNPQFDPPESTVDILFRIDAFSGCGDLMFSSHTIYTLTFILTMIKYWYNIYLVVYTLVIQLVVAVLIVAARKHYTIDVFTALYVVPMVWFLLEAYHRDINCREIGLSAESIEAQYGIQCDDEVYGHGFVDVKDTDSIPIAEDASSSTPKQNFDSMVDGKAV